MSLKTELQARWDYHKAQRPTFNERVTTCLEYIANSLREVYEKHPRSFVKIKITDSQTNGIHNLSSNETLDWDSEVLKAAAQVSKDEWEIECKVQEIATFGMKVYTFYVELN